MGTEEWLCQNLSVFQCSNPNSSKLQLNEVLELQRILFTVQAFSSYFFLALGTRALSK